jgi:pimeloyl-ACP methyl ester carboxylesterase
MSLLDAPGARLYYETRGAGPVMLLVPGANGDARIFTSVAEQLAQHHTVVTYDRRGFSRSCLDGAQDYAHRLATDADDARRLIEHVGDGSAVVFGSSAGGVVSLQLLIDHPHAVRTLVPHEPAAFRLLPDAQLWLSFFDELYDLYRQQGPAPARATFLEHTFPESDRVAISQVNNPANGSHIIPNTIYWFERELREYTGARLDLDALIQRADRIIPTVGRASPGYPTHAVGIELSKTLGRDLLELPSGHIGYATQPVEFATELLAALH